MKPETENRSKRGVAMKRSLGFICLLVMIAILITAAPILRLSDVGPVAFAQAFATSHSIVIKARAASISTPQTQSCRRV